MKNVVFRRIGGRIIPIAKNVGIGAVAGGASARLVSDALAGETAQKKGAKYGAVIGAVASIPAKSVFKGIKHFASTYAKGLKAIK